jgi:D-sedoheptulose 7-phosphate isomerase
MVRTESLAQHSECGMTFSRMYLEEVVNIAQRISDAQLEAAVELLSSIRDRGGRLFILGVGGSAANAAHAVNDFRKLAHFEAYAPTDNVRGTYGAHQ